MDPKINAYFVICLILFSMFPVKADAPILYNKELASDVELRGTFFTNDNSDGFYVSFDNGIIKIDSNNHFTDKTIKIKGTALTNRLKKYNGFNVGITHISDNGLIKNEIKSLFIDNQGFAYLTCDFSTVIINGMTGTTTTTLAGLSGNQSFSVPDGSSYDFNITNNQPSVWTINDTDFSKRILWTLNTTSENLTDIQVGRVTPYDSDMQPDMDDRQLTYYGNVTLISFWDKAVINSTNATGYVKVPKTSTTEQQHYWLYYGNSSIDSASSSSTFPFFDGAESGVGAWTFEGSFSLSQSSTYASEGIYSMKVDGEDTGGQGAYRALDQTYTSDIIIEFSVYPEITTENIIINLEHTTNDYTNAYYIKFGEDGNIWYYDGSLHALQAYSADTWYDITVISDFTGNTFDIIINGTTYNDCGARGTVSQLAGIEFLAWYANTEFYIDSIRSRQYTPIEPIWLADGEEQTASGTINITASVTGDNNTQSYNTSQSREFTLTPTGTTNNVLINTTSTDYDIIVTTYWTEDTTLQSETATTGYAKQYINYTPSFNVTNADLNTTFAFDFSAQDYIGTATSKLNDVSKTTIRDGQDINASVDSLTASIPYWWNVTVPYNNIFTLSEQGDHTVYLGIEESFTDSTYNDPEGLPIDTRLWKFGDGDTLSSSNPTHTYIALGNLQANYSVTETATISPQTIVREFNVSVEIQNPQNITTIPHQTNVSINWDDYTYADKYSVYELEDGFPYVTTNPTIDGVKDAIYDYAHEFLIFSPNPVNPRDYETIYPLRTSLGAYFLIESVDNDNKLGDDDCIYYLDLDNNGLTVDDPAWKITNNIVKKYLWDGSTWKVTGVSNAVGASTGGGTHYPIHELFIPIAELGANWTNGSTVKVLVKREDSSLTPDVITWYPYGNINDTDTNLWQEMVLNEPESYTWLANVTSSNYTALNLTPFTIYHGAVSSWNGTTESDYALFDVITEDVLRYTVVGYILDEFGNSIAGATVWAINGFVCEMAQSEADGYYTGCIFEIGEYNIYANKTGYAENFTYVNVTGNMTNINVTLTAFEMTDWMLWEKLLEIEAQNKDIKDDINSLNSIIWVASLLAAVVVISVLRKKLEEYE